MNNESQLRDQIESIREMRNIIHSMRSLAATHYHQAEKQLKGVRAYRQTVVRAISDCLASRKIGIESENCDKKGGVAVLTIFSEQGLCGRFNEILAEAASEESDKLASPEFIIVGRKGPALLKRYELPILMALPSISSPEQIDNIIHRVARQILKGYEEDRFCQLHLLHASHAGVGTVKPVIRQLLPLDLKAWNKERAGNQGGKGSKGPLRLGISQERLLSQLINEHAFISLTHAFTESLAAENGMRLKSMEGAKQNIEENLKDLQQRARLQRQNAITGELLDIVNGSESYAAS